MNVIMPRASTLLKASLAAGAALATGLLLTQCGEKNAAAPSTASAHAGFDVKLSLTPAAAGKLAALGKPAVVDAFYYGLPTEATASKVDDEGHITLGQNFASASQSGTVTIDGSAVDPDMLDKIRDSAISVTVRAYLDPTAGAKNMLNCTQFDGPVKTAQAQPVAITCDVK